MRVALLSDASAVHTRRWGDALSVLGHDVELISLESGHGLEYRYPLHELRSSVPFRFLKYPLATSRVRGLLRRFRPDVVNAHFVPNYGLIGVLARVRPLVVSVWGSDVLLSARSSPLHRARAAYVLRRADAITTDADMLTRAVVELGGDPTRILTVPMGVDLDAFARSTAAGADDRQAHLVVSTRKLEPVYNVDLLVAAIPAVLSRQPAARFVVVGDGPLRAGYEQRLAGERASVDFRGMIPHEAMAATLTAAQVYVSTSLSDSTSVSLLEAMAAGCFPIVSDIEANREWIEDGRNGFLVPVDAPSVLAQRIVQALADGSLRQRARAANLELVRARANWDDNMRAVDELLARQVREHRGGE